MDAFPFSIVHMPYVIAICNLKYFMHKLPPKFCALHEPILESLC